MAIIPGISPYAEKVTLLGGGNLTAGVLELLLARAPNLVVCDGAARPALAAGLTPDAVIGDLDSLDDVTRARLAPETIHFVDDQDTTDFDKALLAIDAPLVLGEVWIFPFKNLFKGVAAAPPEDEDDGK
jgi:thiamine pyrophosphokinase